MKKSNYNKINYIKVNYLSILILLLTFSLFISGCSNINSKNNNNNNKYNNYNDNNNIINNNNNNNNNQNIINKKNKIIITTIFFPVQDITKNIVNNNFAVKLIIPIGTEPHNFQPSPVLLSKFSNSKVFVIMGGMFANIENNFINLNRNIFIINSSKNFIKNSKDPHIWMSIDNQISMTKEITKELSIKFPEYSREFLNNSNKYIEKLIKLKEDYKIGLNNCSKNIILVNHMAYGNIAKDFGFKQISISGFSPDSEPNPNAIKKVIDIAKENDLHYIFLDKNINSKTTESIANDINATILELNAFPTSKNQSYITMMEENLKNLRIALECK